MNQHRYKSSKPEAEAVACDRACEFVHGVVSNFSGSDVWVFFCDAATTQPLNPTGPPIRVPDNSTASIDWETLKKKYTNGIYVCASLTPWTKSLIVPAADAGVVFELAVNV